MARKKLIRRYRVVLVYQYSRINSKAKRGKKRPDGASEVFHRPLQADLAGSWGAPTWLSARAIAEHCNDTQYVEHHGDCVQGAGREQLRRADPCSRLGTAASPQQSEDSAKTEDTPNAHEANVEGAVAGARKH